MSAPIVNFPSGGEPSPRIRARTRAKRCHELCGLGQLRAPSWVLVQGLVTMEDDDINFVYPHSWLERRGVVYDAVADRFYKKKEYYSIRRALPLHRFTALQAAKEISRSGYFEYWRSPAPAGRVGRDGRIKLVRWPAVRGRK